VSALSGQRIGFIGLGLMGQPMARKLHAAGAAMVVHNRSPAAMLRLHALGMAQAASPAELARACDSVVLMLTDTPAVEQVVAGPGGVLETLRAGALLIDMGTTAVSVTRALAASVREHGAGYVDAPVSGGGFAASRVLEVHGRRMIENDFEPGARCTTQHKDMSQALALAAQLGLELPATALNRDLYQRAMDAGFGALDHSALLRILDPER
jgi:3-hydroxyisobutyrate dehydrogenase-like beta-hydroxyacid dehydrogenase